ncbi:hypothetical protein EVAR_65532_1 [Eumeta japonica]|uniref:DUF5641 domain-containing protein n=1 Tax=Eumeta variegata TaxID=151549 RepID=A0A4C1ZX72_EUMVA|nr:hypothetical protein EVAR_65532_1 [Eumeta japonica]
MGTFILSLSKYISRGNKLTVIFNDNATNFKGINNELSKLLRSIRQSVVLFSNDESIEFKLSSACSPHLEEIWEVSVKSAKRHLESVAGTAALTFEESTTSFTQIEAILKQPEVSPLTPLSLDPTDSSPVAPGHFLLDDHFLYCRLYLSPLGTPRDINVLNNYVSSFGIDGTKEVRGKASAMNRMAQLELRVDDLVILKEYHLRSLQWQLVRINRLYPVSDGITPVFEIQE